MANVVVLGMGGTIAGVAQDAANNVGYKAGAVAVDDILGHALQGTPFAHRVAWVEQVRQKDSKDMQLSDWGALSLRVREALQSPDVCGVVVTHGTDTLEEAAIFLTLALNKDMQSRKPVVLTCAMRPATSSAPDGPQNLRDAFAVAVDGTARGVLLACAGKIFAGHDIRKAHPYRIDAFESVAGGVLGYVEEASVRWLALPCPLWVHAGCFSAHDASAPPSGAVSLLFSASATDAASVQGLVAWASQGGLRGVVVAGTGNGSVHEALVAGLEELRSMGVELILTTRCMAGTVIGTGLGSSYQSMCAALTPFQARIALLLALTPMAES